MILMDYNGCMGTEAEWSVDVPADWKADNLRLLINAGMTALRVCVSGMPILTNPAYAAKIKALADTIHGLGAKVGLSIHDLRSIMSADNSIPPHDMNEEEVIECLCAFYAMGADWVDENEVHKFGDEVNQAWIDHVVTVGLGVRAKYPDAELVLGLPVWSSSFQGDAVGIERGWGTEGGTVWDAVCKPFTNTGLNPYDVIDWHFYGRLADVAGAMPVKLLGKVRWKAGEFHLGVTFGADGSETEADPPVPDTELYAVLDMLKAAGAESVSGWANVDNNEKIPLGLTKRTPMGAAMDTYFARQSVALPWLNPDFYAQNPSASLRDGTDLFNYFQPTADNPFKEDFDISAFPENVKSKLRVDVESQQSAGDSNWIGGAGTDNRAVADYAFYGSADGGKTFSLVPNAGKATNSRFTPNPVVGTTKRTECHYLNCAGFNILRWQCTKARGQQGDQFSVQFNFYDASSCASEADFDRVTGVVAAGDSTDTFVWAYQENGSDGLATADCPHPPFYPVGQPYALAANFVSDANWFKANVLNKPVHVVALITGANDCPNEAWLDNSIAPLAAEAEAADKLLIVYLPLCPDANSTDPNTQQYKVRQALLADYNGKSLYQLACDKFAGRPNVIISDALFRWSYDNPGFMNPNDLHQANYPGWRETFEADICLKALGWNGAPFVVENVKPTPIDLPVPTPTPTPANPAVTLSAPSLAVSTVSVPETPVAIDTPVAVVAAPVSAALDFVAQLNALQKSVLAIASELAGLIVSVTAQEQKTLAALGAVNTGQPGWIINGTPAVPVNAASVASCAVVDGAAYISLNEAGQASDGLYPVSLPFHSDTAGTLKGVMAASGYMKSVSLNGHVQGGIPYVDWRASVPFHADGVIVGANTLQVVVERDGQGLMALAVAFEQS